MTVQQLEKNISYRFQNEHLAELALTHRSANRSNNERLEFLGDALLGFTIADELLQRYPEASEGELSRLRSRLVNQQTLADLAVRLHLGQLLILGPGELKSGGRQRVSILADAVEAVVGAVYLDGGLDVCRTFVMKLYAQLLEYEAKENAGKDPKTYLQEFLQSKNFGLPHYQVVSIEGEEHEQTFLVSCRIALLPEVTLGCGRNRRLAEQQAASNALLALGI